jgi:hypothetical protein
MRQGGENRAGTCEVWGSCRDRVATTAPSAESWENQASRHFCQRHSSEIGSAAASTRRKRASRLEAEFAKKKPPWHLECRAAC